MGDKINFVFEAIGTKWVIDIFDPLSNKSQAEVLQKIRERIDLFDQNYSRFRKDSLVSKMSQVAGEYTLPEDAQPLFDLYQKLYLLTEGKFTPMIGNVLEEAGYDANYSLKPKKLKKPLTWEEALNYKYPLLKVRKPVTLDVGAGGKGYLIDLISELLEESQVKAFCIDAGGDILYKNPSNQELQIGLEHPENLEQVIGVVNLVNRSICGSAGNRRKWLDYHHIIDPQNLSSPQHILATWVVAKETLLADALSTCLFFVNSDKLEVAFDFEYLIVYKDYSIDKSANFPGELFYAQTN